MIPRYTPPDFEKLWSSEHKYATWLAVELAACEAMEEHGLVPKGTAAVLRSKNLVIAPARVEELERTTRHDVIAFLTHVEEQAGEPARWLHRGMTSSDVLDTASALLLREATDRLLERLRALLHALRLRVEEHRNTAIMGRSHGVHAEPTTFGVVLAGHLAELARGFRRLLQAREEIAVGTLSGAVGTYAHLGTEVEAQALQQLGLRAETVPTQVVPRDRHAAYFAALAVVAAGIERLALQVRHWQRTEVLEAEEPFEHGQKGSSAMPHKRNPIVAENLCGLARLMRAWSQAAQEDVALWHERDISHSSVERFVFPDATTTLAFMLERARKMIDGLRVYPENMKKNLERTGGLWASEAVLLELVAAGMGRQEAYVLVQRNAMRAFRGEGDFRGFLLADADIAVRLPAERINACFELGHALRYTGVLVDRALQEAAETLLEAREAR